MTEQQTFGPVRNYIAISKALSTAGIGPLDHFLGTAEQAILRVRGITPERIQRGIHTYDSGVAAVYGITDTQKPPFSLVLTLEETGDEGSRVLEMDTRVVSSNERSLPGLSDLGYANPITADESLQHREPITDDGSADYFGPAQRFIAKMVYLDGHSAAALTGFDLADMLEND